MVMNSVVHVVHSVPLTQTHKYKHWKWTSTEFPLD